MKKIIAAGALAATAIIPFGPAAADAPTERTEVFEFQEPDPCNPDVIQTTTLRFEVKLHGHRNVNVMIGNFTAETDTGYFGSGRGTVVQAKNHFTETQTALVRNAEGDRYKVNFHVTGTPNGIAVEKSNIRCVTNR